MAEEVKLPQLGESVTEGTITAWLIEEGERVEEDQPLFEISTEKIDTEVPSPATGVLKEIRAQVDETVEVGEVVAIIASEDEAEGDTAAEEPGDGDEAEEPADRAAEQEEDQAADEGEAAPGQEEAAEDGDGQAEPAAQEETTEPEREPEPEPRESGNGQAEGRMLSPIVRKLVREHDLDPSDIEGTGQGGRITREDVEKAIQEGPSRGGGEDREAARPAAAPGTGTMQRPQAPKPMKAEGRSQTEKLSRVRQAVAKGMWTSLHTSAQLTAGMEVDVTRIMKLREETKEEFKRREGVSLTPLPFFARAVCMTLPRHPSLNAAIDLDEGTATYYQFVNLGIAVDAEQGLIVPNIKNADDLTIPALARHINDLADRTRNRKLQPDEVKGGTFTITNTGSRGVLFDTPVLNAPEVGILATPKIEKRPIVVTDQFGEDAIAIRYMTYLCLTYDHQMVDGADAARFLTDLKEVLEEHDFAPEVGVEGVEARES